MRIVDNGYGWEIRAFGVEVIEFAAYDEAYEYYMAHKQPPCSQLKSYYTMNCE